MIREELFKRVIVGFKCSYETHLTSFYFPQLLIALKSIRSGEYFYTVLEKFVYMGFWSRFTKSQDPLLKVLLERYRLNPLSIPREKASVGDLYVQEGNSQYVSTPGSVTNFLEPPFMIPAATVGEVMADVSGSMSRDASGRVGLDFLEGFLNALASGGVGTRARGAYESSSSNKITFTFSNPTRDYLDPGLIGKNLANHRFMKRHALVTEGRRYYLVTAVARSSGLTIMTEGLNKQAMEVNAKVMDLVNIPGNVSVIKGQTGSITFMGQKNLVFGVELYELEYFPDDRMQGGKFQMNTQQKAVVARGEESVPLFDNDVTILTR